jgi:hypothetical protein
MGKIKEQKDRMPQDCFSGIKMKREVLPDKIAVGSE